MSLPTHSTSCWIVIVSRIEPYRRGGLVPTSYRNQQTKVVITQTAARPRQPPLHGATSAGAD